MVTVLGQVVNLLTEQNVAQLDGAAHARATSTSSPTSGDITATRLHAPARGARRAGAWRRCALLGGADAASRCRRREYAAWQANVRLAAPSSAAGHRPGADRAQTRFVNPRRMRRGISQEEGEPLDARQLARDLVREFSQGDLHSLDYSVVRERDKTILRITPVEKPWGPNYLRFGLNLASDFRSDVDVQPARALPPHVDELARRRMARRRADRQRAERLDRVLPAARPAPRHVRARRTRARGLRKAPIYDEGDRLAIYRIQENRAGIDVGVQPRRVRGAGELGLGGAAHRRRCSTPAQTTLPNLTAAARRARPRRSRSTPTTSRSSRRAA